MHQISRQLRNDTVGKRIRVTEICPGRVETEIFGRNMGGSPEAMDEAWKTYYEGYESLTTDDIVNALDYAIETPRHVNVGMLELMPTFQVPGGLTFDRRSLTRPPSTHPSPQRIGPPMQKVRTVSFPDAQLLADLSPLPDGLRGVVWDLKADPVGVRPGEIDGRDPPVHRGVSGAGFPSPRGLKFVQTQSTGYDGVIEAAGPAAGVATASGVHAAATAELAVGLILAKLRGIDQAVRDQQHSSGIRSAASPWPTGGSCWWGSAASGARSPAAWNRSTSRSPGWAARPGPTHDGHVHASADLARARGQTRHPGHRPSPGPTTHHLIGEEVLAALPDGALVVNVGRGAVVDTAP